MAAKVVPPDLEQFSRIKGRVNELYENCGDTIREKRTVQVAGNIFTDMEFMIAEINRLSAGKDLEDPKRFAKIQVQVSEFCEEQSKAIKNGQFIKVNSGIFGVMRFLVRALEKVILAVVDDDDARRIKKVKLADENTSRVEFTLDDEIADPDEPATVQKEEFLLVETPVGAIPKPNVPSRMSAPASPAPRAVNAFGPSKIKADDLPGGDAPPG